MAPLKSATTKVTVEKTQQALVLLLNKFGARGFGFDVNPETDIASVRFAYPIPGGELLPVEIQVSVRKVHARLYAKTGGFPTAAIKAARMEQAKRTAWRLLFDWLDCALNTVAMGAQDAEDVFLAHSYVRIADGTMVLVKDYTAKALAGGSLPLLGSGL